jgi:hypothetical protein
LEVDLAAICISLPVVWPVICELFNIFFGPPEYEEAEEIEITPVSTITQKPPPVHDTSRPESFVEVQKGFDRYSYRQSRIQFKEVIFE